MVHPRPARLLPLTAHNHHQSHQHTDNNTTTVQKCSTFNPLNSPSVDPALNTAPLPSTGMPKLYSTPGAPERHHASSATRLRVTPHLGVPSPSRRSVRLGSTRAHESAPTSVAPCVGWAAARWPAGALGTATVMVKEGTRHRANELLGAGLDPESVCAVRYEGEEEEGDRMEGRRGMNREDYWLGLGRQIGKG